MLSVPAVASRAARSVCALSLHSRRLATQVPATTAGSSSQATKEDGPLRPHLQIPVNPNHGLYSFFRKKEKDGKTFYDTVEPADLIADKSGRAWTAAELRRKSFKDLHTLWYVVLRERNLLATQQAEARRLGANEQALGLWAKAFRCRKTMARLKYVINERRVAYEGALQIYNKRHEKLLRNQKPAPVVRLTEEEEARLATRARSQEESMRQRAHIDDIVTRSFLEPEVAQQKA
ncbi:MRP-L47-domain-containing protein [Ganoderma leucocontextum]|nr:MRP-L47-domain-containing protein [Ganoderma leucocontextum]